MNKKAFLARDWVVAFTVCVALFAIGYLMVSGLATEYDNTDIIDEGFDDTYNRFEDISEDVAEMQNESTSESGLKVIGTITTMFDAGWTIIQLVFESLLLPGTMLEQFAIDVGAPKSISNIIFVLPIVVITIIIVFVVISAIMKGKL